MRRLQLEVLVFSALLASFCGANKDAINADLVNSKVQKTIDLTSHLPKITSSITLENTGKDSVRSFLFAADPTLTDNLSFIGAVTKSSGDDESSQLKVTETTVSSHSGVTFYRIDLPSSLGSGQSINVDVDTVFPHSLTPYPQSITQAEKQYMKFSGNHLFYSPYKTKSVTTEVQCSGSIESHTKVKATTSENTITYGPFEDVQKFSEGELLVHYENNGPFLTVTNMLRLIELSHWGNIAVEETVDILHTGAQLKGPFSRYDYQRNQDGQSSIKAFKTALPATARDVYYRDEIGNISTSNLRDLEDMVELELRPRFPLFGGWKTHYLMGYNVPSYQYLYNNGDQYVLKMRFVDHVYDDQVIEQLNLRIMLPEGASNIELKTPYPVQRGADEVFYTYLDTTGRPVIVARKTDLVEQHIQDFEVRYTFPKILLLREPAMVVGAFYLLFVLIIIYVRMDFSITKDEASESRMRVASLIEEVQTVQDRRSALYQSYEDAVNKYKASKDTASFTTNRKRIDSDHKQLTSQITALQAKLKAEGADVVEKIAELQRLDTQVREQINLAIQAAERLVGSKMNKQQYVDYEATVKSKRDEVLVKLDQLLTSL